MEQSSYTMTQFILSVAIILLIIFALEEDKINCTGSESYDNDYGYFWFDTLNTLTTVPLGCSIIAFMYIYTKMSDEDPNNDENKVNDENEQPETEVQTSKIYVISFIFQPCLPILLLSGAIIEFLVVNNINGDCFNKGLNVGVSIICDGIAILLLTINFVAHAVTWIMRKYQYYRSKASSSKDENSSIIDKSDEQEERLQESVSMDVVIDKEGTMENTYSYINSLGSTPMSPSVDYVHVPKDHDQDNEDESVEMMGMVMVDNEDDLE